MTPPVPNGPRDVIGDYPFVLVLAARMKKFLFHDGPHDNCDMTSKHVHEDEWRTWWAERERAAVGVDE